MCWLPAAHILESEAKRAAKKIYPESFPKNRNKKYVSVDQIISEGTKLTARAFHLETCDKMLCVQQQDYVAQNISNLSR